MRIAQLPGGTSLSELRVYDSVSPDGLAGGAPHVHLASSEAYVVTGGVGELHSVTVRGAKVTPLSAGVVVSFGPGVIHRAVNLGSLEMRVVMSNAGLPEAGDAVMTFPEDILADPEAYLLAASLPPESVTESERLEAALKRRDLAVKGYRSLFDGDLVDMGAFSRFLEQASALVAPRLDLWRQQWSRSAERASMETEHHISALEAGEFSYLNDASIAVAQTQADLGMCGWLNRITEPMSEGTATQ